jgi:hypothetical protein
MYPHWTELRSDGQARLQQLIAEADEWRLAQRAAPPRPAGPSVRQVLAAAAHRFAPLPGAWAARAVARARLALTHA